MSTSVFSMTSIRTFLKISFCSAVLTASACNALIDVQPRFNIPTAEALATATDLEAAVNGAYSAIQAAGGLGVAMRLVPEIISDNIQLNEAATRNGQQLYYGAFQRNLFGAADNIWRDGYTAIERANNVISAIDKGYVKLIDNNYLQNRSRLRGEALFIRGIMHFELVRLYGHQFGHNSDAEQSGVIIRTTPTADRVGLPRSTVTQVYAQVVKDLTEAVASLPVGYDGAIHPTSYGGRVGGRATKDAARAYLAKVYFQMGTPTANALAANLIDSVMGDAPGLPIKYWNPAQDYIRSRDDNFFYKSGNNAAAQTIFQIVNTYNPATNELSSTAGGFLNAYLSASLDPTEPDNAPFPVYLASTDFTKSLSAWGVKRSLLYLRKSPGTNYYVFKFLRRAGQPATINIPIIRGADLLLMRAEINAYNNNLDGAKADVNAVRAAAELLPIDNMDQTALIKEIAKERRIELGFEGDRFFDFKRRNMLDRNTFGPGIIEPEEIGPGGSGSGRIYTRLRWDSPLTLLQIPDAEVFSNAQVRRNP